MTGAKDFAADNETVAKEKVEYVKLDHYSEIRADING
jgi:hypothetical protein